MDVLHYLHGDVGSGGSEYPVGFDNINVIATHTFGTITFPYTHLDVTGSGRLIWLKNLMSSGNHPVQITVDGNVIAYNDDPGYTSHFLGPYTFASFNIVFKSSLVINSNQSGAVLGIGWYLD
jgi:hypothetical protein